MNAQNGNACEGNAGEATITNGDNTSVAPDASPASPWNIMPALYLLRAPECTLTPHQRWVASVLCLEADNASGWYSHGDRQLARAAGMKRRHYRRDLDALLGDPACPFAVDVVQAAGPGLPTAYRLRFNEIGERWLAARERRRSKGGTKVVPPRALRVNIEGGTKVVPGWHQGGATSGTRVEPHSTLSTPATSGGERERTPLRQEGARVPDEEEGGNDRLARIAGWTPNAASYQEGEGLGFRRAYVDERADAYRAHASTLRYAESTATLDAGFLTWLRRGPKESTRPRAGSGPARPKSDPARKTRIQQSPAGIISRPFCIIDESTLEGSDTHE